MYRSLIVIVSALYLYVALVASASACTLVWQAPTTNTNGSPLTDLSHSNAYYQKFGGSNTLLGTVPAGQLSYTIPMNCQVGVYKVGAVNSSGIESVKAQVVVRTPSQPSQLEQRN